MSAFKDVENLILHAVRYGITVQISPCTLTECGVTFTFIHGTRKACTHIDLSPMYGNNAERTIAMLRHTMLDLMASPDPEEEAILNGFAAE